MTTRNKFNFHKSALKFAATEAASLERLKANPVDDSDRTILDATVKITPPLEMLNDEKERHRYGTVASIQMAWCLAPASEPKERDRLVSNGIDFRIRKVKPWPNIATPAFYELHIEDES